MELTDLLQRCRQGDGLAWEALVRRYQARVYGLAMSYMRNAEEARDAAQEIFVRVYNKLDTFREQETFLPWLLRLGRNVCIDQLRRAKARPADAGAALDDVPDFADSRGTPEEAAETQSRQRLVYRALDKLSEPYREMILLKEIQGLKLEEISSMLDIPVGTVKSRSNRARIELARAVLEICPSAGSGAI
jgi:RNA polymerase sigma-70 factor (ECF subfamily)